MLGELPLAVNQNRPRSESTGQNTGALLLRYCSQVQARCTQPTTMNPTFIVVGFKKGRSDQARVPRTQVRRELLSSKLTCTGDTRCPRTRRASCSCLRHTCCTRWSSPPVPPLLQEPATTNHHRVEVALMIANDRSHELLHIHNSTWARTTTRSTRTRGATTGRAVPNALRLATEGLLVSLFIFRVLLWLINRMFQWIQLLQQNLAVCMHGPSCPRKFRSRLHSSRCSNWSFTCFPSY